MADQVGGGSSSGNRYLINSRRIGGANRKFNESWLAKYTWLRYSVSRDAVYCVNCLLFGKKDSKYKTFSSEPVSDWSNLPKLIHRHVSQNDDHHKSSLLAENFIRVAEGEAADIHCQVNAHHRQVIELNRGGLESIIRCLLLCARNNIPLRGHRRDDGNFAAILAHRAETDVALQQFLQNVPRNASYQSPEVQNELLNICAHELRGQIVADCNRAGMFALMADECTDVASREQISLCVRFFDTATTKIREEFLGFVKAERTTGRALARTFLNTLDDFGINVAQMRAQSYDGAPNMSGIHNGVQAIIRTDYPFATYVYCRAHCLNICIVHSCQLPLVRNLMDTIQQISFSFKASAKRLSVYEEELQQNDEARENMENKTKLQVLCDTRWASRANALFTFKASYDVIISALERLDEDGGANARAYKASISKFDFIMSLVVCEHTFSLLAPLSKLLQTTDLDLIEACREAETVLNVLERERMDDTVWDALYDAGVTIAQRHEIEPCMPRCAGRQRHRENVQANTPTEYWKRALYLPLVDHLLVEMREKLVDKRNSFCGQYLIPSKIAQLTPAKVQQMYHAFEHDLCSQEGFHREVQRWVARCQALCRKKMPKTRSHQHSSIPWPQWRSYYTQIFTRLSRHS